MCIALTDLHSNFNLFPLFLGRLPFKCKLCYCRLNISFRAQSPRDLKAMFCRRQGVPSANADVDGPTSDGVAVEVPAPADGVAVEVETPAPVASFISNFQHVVARETESDKAAADRVPVKNKGGAKRRDWREIGRDEFQEPENLRQASQRWLRSKSILHSTLSNSSHKKRVTLIARCSKCLDCDKAWCFSFEQPNTLLIESAGECSENLNLNNLKTQEASCCRVCKTRNPSASS